MYFRMSPAAYELITSDTALVNDFPRSSAIDYRQAALALSTWHQLWIQQSNLDEHSSLIPVYVLMVQFPSSNTFDYHERNLDVLVRGFYIWQKPWHHLGVFE